MATPSTITVLGGGPAGLAVGYFARKKGLPFTIYESSQRTGGNCVTLRHGDFLFDSGAHRFHDKDPEMTAEVKGLLGPELMRINVPSKIHHRGKFIDFPISPLNLLRTLGLATFFRAIMEIGRERLRPRQAFETFEGFAVRTYGRTLAERFLLGYSRKLWGLPCDRLSPSIAGKRLKGLDLATFVKEAILGQGAKTQHLEGADFYYPRKGFGVIADRLAEFCGAENIRCKARVTRILHDGKRVRAVVINDEERVPVSELVSTLPLDVFVSMMAPPPAAGVEAIGHSLRYRNLLIVALFLNRESITRAATVYFPDSETPLTRVCEPRNRSRLMSPRGQTSLLAEIPCQTEDAIWRETDETLVDRVRTQLVSIGWIEPQDVIGSLVGRLQHAYPILEVGFDQKLAELQAYFSGFSNLRFSGRNGKFAYTWLHDMMRFGKELIDQYPH